MPDLFLSGDKFKANLNNAALNISLDSKNKVGTLSSIGCFFDGKDNFE